MQSLPYRAQRAEQMSLHRAFLHSGGASDFQQIHVFHEAQQEDRPLASGKLARCLPNRRHLFI
jgi:hypothetical protein